MKKIDLSQTITILANLGVIAGIIFLGLELRQTQSALVAEAYQTRALDSISSAWNELSADDEFLTILIGVQNGFMEIRSLTPVQRRRMYMFLKIVAVDADNEHYQYENGFLDTDFYRTATVPNIETFAPIWRSIGVTESRQRFCEVVNEILADPALERDCATD